MQTDCPDARAVISQFATALDGAVPVISRERLSGYFFSGGMDSYVIANRIKATIPNARILVTVRNQEDLIFSSYLQYLRRGGTMTLRTSLRQRRDDRFSYINFAYFEFHHLIEYYVSLFGVDNVLVLPYEHLFGQNEQAMSELAHFSGASSAAVTEGSIRVNPGNLFAANLLVRPINHWLQSSSVNGFARPLLSRIVERERLVKLIDHFVPDSLEENAVENARAMISENIPLERYRASNQRLQVYVKQDLATLGYPL